MVKDSVLGSFLSWRALPFAASVLCAGLALVGCSSNTNVTNPNATDAGACPSGQLSCSGSCVDSTNDPKNCGSCGNACTAGQVCSSGKCSSGCGSSQTECTPEAGAPYCANTDSDNQNCGSCGNACTAGQVCSSGKCSSGCGSSQTECTPEAGAPYCANTDSDNQNCGSCGNACTAGQVCSGGNCVTSCPASQVDCGGSCVDPNTSSAHCGASGDCSGANAGTACTAKQQCVNGTCKAVQCSSNADCDDKLYCDGTEKCDPKSPAADAFGCVAGTSPCASYQTCSEANKSCSCAVGWWADCGQCGTRCKSQQACQAGSCVAARRVFVTSTTYTGNMGGLAGADADCQGLADSAGLGGTWKAYMVDANTDLSRLSHANVPYVRLDGVEVATNWTDLSDGSILAPIDVTEQGLVVGGDTWTGMFDVAAGGNASNSCNNWKSSAGGCNTTGICGGGGESQTVDTHWDGYYIFDCNHSFRLYCIEQ